MFISKDYQKEEFQKMVNMPGGQADYYRSLLKTKTNPDDLKALKRIGLTNYSVWQLKPDEV